MLTTRLKVSSLFPNKEYFTRERILLQTIPKNPGKQNKLGTHDATNPLLLPKNR